MRGFTLLEVMVALAILGGVVLTILESVNFHLGSLSTERDSSTLVLLARNCLTELEQKQPLPQKQEGDFAPAHPDVTWHAEVFPTQYPVLQKLVVKVRRSSDRRETALVRYVLK